MEQANNQKSFANTESNVLTTNGIENYDLKASNATCSLILFYMQFVCHLYFFLIYSYITRMSFVCARVFSVCHSYAIHMSLYVLACHLHVTLMYLYVIRMYSYVTRMSLVFYHEPRE